jgi:hypothetical protein
MTKEFEMLANMADDLLNITIMWIVNNDAKNLEEVVYHLIKDE